MLTEERQNIIAALVESKGSMTVQQLMEELHASESTIRRDLNALDASGRIVKVHGGAVALDAIYNTRDDEVALRKGRNRESKLEIAKYAATLIQANDFVYLDAGTTTELMIDFITEKSATFVTNAVSHAKKLSQLGYQTYILGGEFKAATEAIVGDEAVEGISKYNFTKGFLGSNGVNVERGFSTPDVKEAMLKREAIRHCEECYILCDSSKISKISCVSFGRFDQATILTTTLKDDEYRKYKNIVEV